MIETSKLRVDDFIARLGRYIPCEPIGVRRLNDHALSGFGRGEVDFGRIGFQFDEVAFTYCKRGSSDHYHPNKPQRREARRETQRRQSQFRHLFFSALFASLWFAWPHRNIRTSDFDIRISFVIRHFTWLPPLPPRLSHLPSSAAQFARFHPARYCAESLVHSASRPRRKRDSCVSRSSNSVRPPRRK